LISLGYQQSKNDYSLLINKPYTHITLVAVYVDGILITGLDLAEMKHVKQHLNHCFGINIGKLNYFLGLEVSYIPEGILLS